MKCALSVLTLVVASALPLAARAQAAWPSHTVRIIATSPPGGSVDFLARALAEDFSRTLDRKSTRLNSSHVKISYAVFCLKKKKKNSYSTNYIHHQETHGTTDP